MCELGNGASHVFDRSADYKSAIQQNTILRYAFGQILRDALKTFDNINSSRVEKTYVFSAPP